MCILSNVREPVAAQRYIIESSSAYTHTRTNTHTHTHVLAHGKIFNILTCPVVKDQRVEQEVQKGLGGVAGTSSKTDVVRDRYGTIFRPGEYRNKRIIIINNLQNHMRIFVFFFLLVRRRNHGERKKIV